MTERILVVDPGERVGWCHANIELGEIIVTGHGITAWKDFVLKFYEVCGNYDTVILESYRIYAALAQQHSGSDVPTLQCVGQIKLVCWLNPKVKLVMQAPTVQKNGIKVAPAPIREILDRLPKSHDEAHDGSALAHLSHYWFKNYAG